MTERPEKLGQLALNKKGGMFYSGKCNCPASLQVLRSYNSETNDGNQEIIIIWLLCKQNITGLKNPNWREEGSVGYLYTSVTKDLSRHDREQSSKSPERDSNPAPAGLRVRCSDHSATLPPIKTLLTSVLKKC